MIDAKNVLKKNIDGINDKDVTLIPGFDGVLVTLYEDNPYRHVEKTESGLILGIESSKKYVSHETGEVEENDEYIVCAHVVEVGPEVKHVKVGEDIYFPKHIALVLPFRKKGYFIINERNITCRVAEKVTTPEKVSFFSKIINLFKGKKND